MLGAKLCARTISFFSFLSSGRPRSVSELQRALKVASKFGIPLWTFSRGKNLGQVLLKRCYPKALSSKLFANSCVRYGGPAPKVAGSVAVDLHRMNKIIEVNEKFSYAVVEPGVTFTDLYDYCVEHNLAVWPSVPSLGWGSVVGNVCVCLLAHFRYGF